MLPLQCMLCAGRAHRGALCAPCRDDLRLLKLPAPCARCGQPQAAPLCAACLQKPPPLDGLAVLYKYQPPLDMLILSYKYGKRWQLAPTLAELMPPPPPAELVIPVPLHPARERWRGFNQARELAKKMKLRPAEGMLTRIKNTPPQAGLADRSARRSSIRGAFAADPAVRGLSALLVDDVMTSGATLYEAARTLKKAGARSVHAALAARAVTES